MITAAVYPEVLAELLIVDEESDVDARALDVSVEALALLNHPDAHFVRVQDRREVRFVSYRIIGVGWQVVSVPVPLRGRTRPPAVDELRAIAFEKLIELLSE